MPIVQKLVGATPLSIHKLYGPETLEIRMLAWCDVFSAMATSRPTRLVYDCNVGPLLQRNQEGPDTPLLDRGIEWMSGLPDAFLLLTIQILNLKHGSFSPTERTSRAAGIEAALRGWKVWPSGITNSVMIIQRASAQEIWRHFTILYLYQAVHKATPNQVVVQQSVKQIIKLASTLRPGHNPDCLLYVAYFLAGTFAISAKDRRFIRDRLMRCNFGTYVKTLVDALDELWAIDKHVDWTSRSPPLVMF
ncbi:fungal-specific transcription factor domain-containing protein [Rhizoctonia solani]|nr:fungal-specific transcription factor domain-containing protein [Rhizoctonia solani]